MKIILASKSPRRREILSLFTNNFEIIKTEVIENFNDNYDILTNIMAISRKKASSIKTDLDSIIISADTIVLLDNKVLGKAGSAEEAFKDLSLLSGKTHQVITAFSIKSKTKTIVDYEITKVSFKDLSDDDINSYIKTGEWEDKAGAYAIQGKGSALVEKISGDYFNVVGLPISKINDYLKVYFTFDLLRS